MFSFISLCFILFFQLAHRAHNNTKKRHEKVSIHIISVLIITSHISKDTDNFVVRNAYT